MSNTSPPPASHLGNAEVLSRPEADSLLDTATITKNIYVSKIKENFVLGEIFQLEELIWQGILLAKGKISP